MIQGFSKFGITKELRKILLDDSELKSLVNNNIFPLIAPENTTGDVILYYRDEYGKEHTQMGVYKDKCKVFFAVISENYDRSILISEKINDILEGVHSTTTENYKYTCNLIDSTEDFEDKKYIQILLFSIT